MKKVVALFLGIFLLSVVSALQIKSEFDTQVILKEFDSEILMTLYITNAPEGLYNVYTLSDLSIKPSEMFSIDGGSLKKVFTIVPTENLDVEGYYTFTYTLNHRGGEKYDNRVTVNIVNLADILEIYTDNVDDSNGEIELVIKNKENVGLSNLSGTFSCLLFDFEKTLDLKPYEEKRITVKVDKEVLQKTKSGTYIIESSFMTDRGLKIVDGKLYLGEKKGITTKEDKSGIFIHTNEITKLNIGNTLETVKVEVDKNIFSRLFTSFSIEPNLVERNGFGVHYTWIKNRLQPMESFTVVTKTNYILPFAIIIVLIVAFFGIKRYSQTKVEVIKTVSPIKTKNGEFALKIKLFVKAKKAASNVTLIDRVPAIVKIYNKFGTVKPDKIDATSRRVYWNIGNLDSGEERAFSYIVYSKVGVVGKFSLPGAVLVFEEGEKIHEVESNHVFFMNEQIRKEPNF